MNINDDTNDAPIITSGGCGRKGIKSEYMTATYLKTKAEFDAKLCEFDINLYNFEKWSDIRNKYLKQYLLLDYVKREYQSRGYRMAKAGDFYQFLQTNINSKTIKSTDIVFSNNVIQSIKSVVLMSDTDFYIKSAAESDDPVGGKSTATSASTATIQKSMLINASYKSVV
jgi:hypothetical protein